MRIAITGLIIGALAVIGIAQQTRGTSSAISENALRAHVKFLSDDRLEGRGTGAKGGETAALYVAEQFEAMGLKGGGAKGSFWQPVSLVGVKANPKTELRVNGPTKAEAFKFADDFVVFTGAQTGNVIVNADLVFVGYGIDAPEQKWNDYKGPAEDYRGKILVMLVNDPPATKEEPNLFGGRTLTYYGRWTYKYEEAARRGAAGALLLHTNESAGYPWSVVRTSNGSWRFDIARSPNDKTPFLPIRSWMTDDAAHRMMQLAGLNLDELRKQAASRDFKPVKLNLTASIDLDSEVKHVEAPNVVAIRVVIGSSVMSTSSSQLIGIISASARLIRRATRFITAPLITLLALPLSWKSRVSFRACRRLRNRDGRFCF